MKLEQIPLILPAAGKSSRLGSPKGLLRFAGRVWLEHQCEAFRLIGGSQVLLILGYDNEQYLEELGLEIGSSCPEINYSGCRLQVLHNMRPELGPFTSLQSACGWIAMHPEIEAAFYLPIDTPVPSEETFSRLVRALDPTVKVAEPRVNNRGGHPLLLSRTFMHSLSIVDPAAPGARLDYQVEHARVQGTVSAVEAHDSRVLLNLNTINDWKDFLDSREMRAAEANANLGKERTHHFEKI